MVIHDIALSVVYTILSPRPRNYRDNAAVNFATVSFSSFVLFRAASKIAASRSISTTIRYSFSTRLRLSNIYCYIRCLCCDCSCIDRAPHLFNFQRKVSTLFFIVRSSERHEKYMEYTIVTLMMGVRQLFYFEPNSHFSQL